MAGFLQHKSDGTTGTATAAAESAAVAEAAAERTVAAALRGQDSSAGSSTATGSSSSNKNSRSAGSGGSGGDFVSSINLAMAERQLCTALLSTAACLFKFAAAAAERDPALVQGSPHAWFVLQPAVPQIALQMLAACSMRLHRQFVKRQQLLVQQGHAAATVTAAAAAAGSSLPLSRQLGRRMRGDLLLLPDPKQRLGQLLPGRQLLDEMYDSFWDGQVETLLTIVDLHLTSLLDSNLNDYMTASDSLDVFSNSIGSGGDGGGGSSSLAVSAAALQLSSQLLLQAAASWQQTYYQLTPTQQTLLATDPAELTQAERWSAELADQSLARDTQLLHRCACFLQTQLVVLQSTTQMQPLLQLLQHQGGEVLLQGLTLTAHCGSLHRRLQRVQSLGLQALLFVLSLAQSSVSMPGTLQIAR
jgi:hypothetical protein